MAAQAAIANNMANVSTTGFRADRVVFDRIELKGGGAQIEARAPTSEEVTDADRSPGAIQQTGRPLDVAMAGDAWMAVQASDGSEGLYPSRRPGGRAVGRAPDRRRLPGDGPVAARSPCRPANSVTIGGDGTISIVPQGGDGARRRSSTS